MMKKKTELVNAGSLSARKTVISIMIIALLFFIFGFTTWINAILIPYFKIACELNNVQSLFVAFAFYIAYFVMAVPAAHLLERVGFKKGIMTGFWIMALGALFNRNRTGYTATCSQYLYHNDRFERKGSTENVHYGCL